jgi:hypothetical protein
MTGTSTLRVNVSGVRGVTVTAAADPRMAWAAARVMRMEGNCMVLILSL